MTLAADDTPGAVVVGSQPRPPFSLVVDRDGDVWAEQPRPGVFQCLTQGECDRSLSSLEQEWGPLHRYVTPAAALAAVGATLEAVFAASEPTAGGGS